MMCCGCNRCDLKTNTKSKLNAELQLMVTVQPDLRFRQMLKPSWIEAKAAVDEYGGTED